MLNPAVLQETLERLIGEMRVALDELEKASRRVAEAEHSYRLAKSEAWARMADDRQVAAAKQAAVDAACADQRYTRDLAEAARVSWLERVRSLRQEISAVQTLANAYREELFGERAELR